MAKVKVDIKLGKNFKDLAKDKVFLTRSAVVIQRNIRANTKEGIGWDGEGFPSLSGSTIARRRALSAVNKTDRFYSAVKANATFTGDLVSKIVAEVKGTKIVLKGKGRHKLLRGIRVKYLDGSNAQIGEILDGLKKIGYRILGVSEKSKKMIKNEAIRALRRLRR